MQAATAAIRVSPSDHLLYSGAKGTFRKKYSRSVAARAAVAVLSAALRVVLAILMSSYSVLLATLRLRKSVV